MMLGRRLLRPRFRTFGRGKQRPYALISKFGRGTQRPYVVKSKSCSSMAITMPSSRPLGAG